MAEPRTTRPGPGAGGSAFEYRGDELYCEDLRLDALADRFGTPLYVYSAAAMTSRFRTLRAAFGEDALICYAVKSNPNLSLLRLFAGLGAGFDLVSGGELRRLLLAGIDPSRAVFAGVGKQAWEVAEAAAAGILFFNVESPHEVDLLAAAGRSRSARVPVAVRLNPGVGADTHAYVRTGDRTSKFGIELDQAGPVVERIARDPRLRLCGYHVHLGSQIGSVEEFLDGAALRRDGVTHYDLGGGFGIGDGERAALPVASLAAAVLPRLRSRRLIPVLEPGRFLVGDAGALLTTVLGRKVAGGRRLLLVDAAMNDLLRPALYQARHPVVPLRDGARATETCDVVGPVCESGDFLALDRALPALQPGERLAVLAAGAYGAAMASNYNSRPRPAEVLVRGTEAALVRRRETLERLWQDEVDLQ